MKKRKKEEEEMGPSWIESAKQLDLILSSLDNYEP